MRPSEQIEKLIKENRYKADSATHDRIFNNVMREMDKYEKQKPGTAKPEIWRIIMKSNITKLTAAAMIIIAAIIIINQFGGSIDVSSVAWADVVRPILTARTATYKTTLRNADTMTEDGPMVIEKDCMFMEPGHIRETYPGYSIIIIDIQQNKILILLTESKRAIAFDDEDFPAESGLFNKIRQYLEQIQQIGNESIEFLGEKEIKEQTAIGYRVRQQSKDITIWTNPETLMPVQMEYSLTEMISYIISDITFDVELDESLFSVEIPEGYH